VPTPRVAAETVQAAELEAEPAVRAAVPEATLVLEASRMDQARVPVGRATVV